MSNQTLTPRKGKRRFVLRYYPTFNTEQCDLPASVIEELTLPEQRQLNPIEACEKSLSGMPNPPEIVHGGDKTFYSPAADRVTLPPPGLFESADEFWAALWHETAGHSTGHPKRLNRDSLTDAAPFGSPVYAEEELIAELSAAYMCGICGIQNRTLDNCAAYLAGWLKALRSQRTLVVHAAAQAQRACDYVLNQTFCSE